jgi:penicillin-binding protein 1A
MTPDIVAGVWLGFDRPTTITPGAAGGSLAAPIFAQMIARYYAGRAPTGSWTAPGGIVTAELDRQTGMVADSLTPPERRYMEYFIQGTEPGARVLDPWTIFRWGPIAF